MSKQVYILDSFAMLAFLEDEEGSHQIETVFEAAQQGKAQLYLSMINLGEVLYITERERGISLAHQILAMIEQLPLALLPVTRERVLQAAHIKANYRLSYADAFAVAAAQEFKGTVMTGDPEFVTVEAIIDVKWLPK